MSERFISRRPSVPVCTADLRPKVPFMPLSERRAHPELLPRVNCSPSYEGYFSEICSVLESFGREAWVIDYEFASPDLLVLGRRALLMPEVINSFNRSRRGRRLNVSGCRLQSVRAGVRNFTLFSESIIRGESEAFAVLCGFLSRFEVETRGVEIEISYRHPNTPRNTEATYRNLWDMAFLSRELWKFVSCERIGHRFVLTLRCVSMPSVGALHRLWSFFEEVESIQLPRFGVSLYRRSPSSTFDFSDFDLAVPAAFLPFRFMPFVRFGDVYRQHRGTYLRLKESNLSRSKC